MALPSAPDGICVISTINALCLRVNWNTVDGVSTYRVFRSEIPHDSFCQIAFNIPGLTYYDNPQSPLNLNIRNVFYYKVAADNVEGLGQQSQPSTFLPYGQTVDINVPRPGLSH